MTLNISTNTTEDISALDPNRRVELFDKMVKHYERQIDTATDDKSLNIAMTNLQKLLMNTPKIIGFQN